MTLVKFGFVAAGLAAFGLAYVVRSEPALAATVTAVGGMLFGMITKEFGAAK